MDCRGGGFDASDAIVRAQRRATHGRLVKPIAARVRSARRGRRAARGSRRRIPTQVQRLAVNLAGHSRHVVSTSRRRTRSRKSNRSISWSWWAGRRHHQLGRVAGPLRIQRRLAGAARGLENARLLPEEGRSGGWLGAGFDHRAHRESRRGDCFTSRAASGSTRSFSIRCPLRWHALTAVSEFRTLPRPSFGIELAADLAKRSAGNRELTRVSDALPSRPSRCAAATINCSRFC